MSRIATGDEKTAMGARLAAVRSASGLGQIEFAQILDLSPRAYANYERGEREMPVVVLKALAEVMRIDPLWMLSGPGSVPVLAGARCLDLSLLEDIMALVEDWLSRNRRALKPDKKARVVRLAYEHCMERGQADAGYIKEMMSLAA